ncbi:DNA polymerase III subunit theta [Pectobacterium brasiliense]|uniref:DNA polymerase III subunit theta n=1 Tax=Pectobacterium brasiliense TaxID=180957 RepID=UPI00406C87AA
MTHNLGDLPQKALEKINVDLAASAVAYKERLNLSVIAEQAEREQPEHLCEYFRKRVVYYRDISKQLSRGSEPVYLKMVEDNGKK